jgi:hypothetical protein
MKLFPSILLACSFTGLLSAQDIRVHDPCTDNTTVYTRLNDSDYRVESHYKDILIFRGAVTRPDTGEQFPGMFYYSGDGRTSMKYQGLCEFYIADRSLYKKAFFVNGNPSEIWEYSRGALVKHEKKEEWGSQVQSYSNDSLREEYIEDYRKRTRTNRIMADGKILESVFVFDNETNSYKPLKKYTTIYYIDGSVQMKLVKFPRSNMVRHEYRYSNANDYQNREHVSRLNQVNEYDKKGDVVRTRSFQAEGRKDVVLEDSRFTRKYDYRGRLLYERSVRKHTGYDTDTFEFSLDTLKNEVRAKDNSYSYVFRLSADGSGASLVYRSTGSNSTTRTMAYASNKAVMRYYENDVLLKSRTFQDYRFYIDPWTFRNIRPGDVENYFPELLRMNNYSLAEEESGNDDDWNSGETRAGLMTDTIFSGGHVTGTETLHGDTFERYYLRDGKFQLQYSTHAFRVAKDIEQCSEGIKDSHGWVIPAQFEHFAVYGYDTNTVYFAANKDFTSIYNWKGELLVPPTEGLRGPNDYPYEEIRISDDMRDSLGLKHNELFIINLPEKRKFYILSLDNKVLLSMPEMIVRDAGNNNYYYNDHENIDFILNDTFGQTGFFDLKGLYIPTIYSSILRIGTHEFIVKKEDSDFYFLNTSGKPMSSDSFYSYYLLDEATILLKDRQYRPRLMSLNTMQYLGEKADFEFPGYFTNGFAHIRKNGRPGIADRNLKIIVPPLYREILVNSHEFIGKNGDTCDFYTQDGKVLQRLVCDSLYYAPYYASQHQPFLLFRKNSRFGLVSSTGKIIVQPVHEIIGQYGDAYLLINDGRASAVEASPDSARTRNIFPALHGIAFTDLANAGRHGMISYKGAISAMDIDQAWGNSDRFTLTPIYRNAQFMGNMNSLGEWVFKTSRYSRTQLLTTGIYYALDHEGKSGVIDCGGNDLVTPASRTISYDHGNRLLWHATGANPSYSSYSKLENVWKLTALGTRKTMDDTLNHPVLFAGNTAIVKNNHGYIAVIDTTLNKVLPFDFTSFSMVDRQNFTFKHKDGSLWVTDLDFNPITKLYLDRVIFFYPSQILGFSDNRIYLLDSNFSLVDSSARFFSDREYDMFQREGFSFAQRIYTDEGNEYHYEEDETGDEEEYHEWMLPCIFNFLACAELTRSSLPEGENFSYAQVFPPREYNQPYYGILPRFPENFNTRWLTSSIAFSLNDTVYHPWMLTLERIGQFENLNYRSHFDRFVTMTHNPPANSSDDSHSASFYIDSASGAFFVPLHELISWKKSTQFILLLKKYLSGMDATEISCFPNSDYMEFFSHKFDFNEKGIRFSLSSEFSFTIPYAELRSLMNPYWRARLKR